MSETIYVDDTENIKNILVQVDLKHGKAQVLSNTSSWENLEYLMQAVGESINECIKAGRETDEVLKATKHHYLKIIKTFLPM